MLLDYYKYATQNNLSYNALEEHAISASDLMACCKAQGVTGFRPGDILLMRTGWKQQYQKLSNDERIEISQRAPPRFAGIETSESTAKWLWDNQFAACAGDQPSWEKWSVDTNSGLLKGLFLHEVMLGGWGLPIGELFDLDALSEECARLKRYTFFFTSMPLHVVGGIASPPNAMAIF